MHLIGLTQTVANLLLAPAIAIAVFCGTTTAPEAAKTSGASTALTGKMDIHVDLIAVRVCLQRHIQLEHFI